VRSNLNEFLLFFVLGVVVKTAKHSFLVVECRVDLDAFVDLVIFF